MLSMYFPSVHQYVHFNLNHFLLNLIRKLNTQEWDDDWIVTGGGWVYSPDTEGLVLFPIINFMSLSV